MRAGMGTTQVATVDWAQTASTVGYGRHFINLGRNLSALLAGKGFAKSGVNIAAHSHGASIGFETSFIFGGVNRFLALDPAILAGGGYSDARPNFRQQTIGGRTVAISTLSTGIKGGATTGTLGNDAMAATCHLTLRLLSNTHTGAAVNAAFFNNLSKDWVRRAMVTTTDAYWPFFKTILLTSQKLPWTGTDLGGGFDIECHGATSRIDNTAPTADVDAFLRHNFLLFKSSAGILTEARATKAADGTVTGLTMRADLRRASLLAFAELVFDLGFDFRVEGLVGLEGVLGAVASLGELGAFVGEPRAALLDDVHFKGEVEERAGGGNALVVHDVELGLGERRGDLVFDDLEFGAVAGGRCRRSS